MAASSDLSAPLNFEIIWAKYAKISEIAAIFLENTCFCENLLTIICALNFRWAAQSSGLMWLKYAKIQ